MSQIAAIVFDFDGVLADSEPLHLRTYREVLARLGITLTRDVYYSELLGYDDVGVFTRVGAAAGIAMDGGRIAALIEEKARVFDEVIASTDVLYPGAVACVERLAASYPLGIASGALKGEIVAILRRAKLDRHFRFIVSAEDTPRSKPAPDPYARAAQLHGVVPAACLAIEDSRWGIALAKAAGLRCVAITHTYPATELTEADAILNSLSELDGEYIAKIAPTTANH